MYPKKQKTRRRTATRYWLPHAQKPLPSSKPSKPPKPLKTSSLGWAGKWSSSSRVRRQTVRNMNVSQTRLHEPMEEQSNGASKRKTRSHHSPLEQVGLPVRVALSRDPGSCTAVGSSVLMTTVQCASSKGETTKGETKNLMCPPALP